MVVKFSPVRTMVCKPRIEGSSDKNTCLNLNKLILFAYRGKIFAQRHTIVKQICFPMAMYCFCHCFLYPGTECLM